MQLKSILDKLDLLDKSELFYSSDIEGGNTLKLPNRLRESLMKINPDALFCINNEPLILFFEGRNSDELEILEKQIWNFNQSPAIFIQEGSQWVIKNGFNFLSEEKKLETISNNISDFEYFKIITGQTWQDYKYFFENKNRVDSFLLNNIEVARNILTVKGNLNPKIANALIGRVIFIKYLIDREVELNKYEILEKSDFYKILSNPKKTYTFFKQIRKDFNGNLFPLEYEIEGCLVKEIDRVNRFHLDTIISLLKGDSLSYSGETQISLFDVYDFSIIPIEFISNVYEKFIGVENQAKKGAYYTPLFLVDYMQKETVSKYFQENSRHYNCKVLDPACGSGIFLVEALRQIIAQYQLLNPIDIKDEEGYNNYKEKLKQLLKDNIFGIDKDDEAISVAIFSLYITLLDNLKPKSIVGFEFPKLQGTNFFNSDFFDESASFNSILKKNHFQFILGNPPWATRHGKKKQPFEDYIEKRRKKEKSSLEIENREIAEAFLVRVSDFNFDECGFIIVSKILYKISRKKEKKGVFRNYFLTNFKIRQVFELSSVRHQIFDKSNDKAVAPATILFYSKCHDTVELNNNIVKHISLKPNVFFETFKLMVIEKYDTKELLQSFFINQDWVWKVLVYGNILDYYFIKRLKDEYKKIGDEIKNIDKYIVGQGVMEGGGDENDFSSFVGYKYINTSKKDVKQFFVNYSGVWENPIVHRNRNPLLFDKNVLLITEGISNKFKAVSAISYEKAVYKSSLTGIRAIDEKDLKVLKSILGLFNSSFFSHYIVNTGSSIGIEREQTHDVEKWEVPYVESINLVDLVTSAEKLSSKLHTSILLDTSLELQIKLEKEKINNEILKLLDVSSQEKSLIDYTNSVTIPLLKGTVNEKKKIFSKIKFKDKYLEEYALIFISHFGNRFNSDNHYFEVEIIHSNHTILMKFEIISKPSKFKNCIEWKNKTDKKLLKNITKLSLENLSNNLYMQKDVKGFEENFFYIAKPNEYKLWHSAIAHLDLMEFIDALNN